VLLDVIRRVASADQGALGELYDATSPTVFGLVRRIVGDYSAAEEVTIDVYTQVWRLASAYSEERGSPVTWLLMIARSRAIDHLRSRARRLKEQERPIEVAFDHSQPGPDPETAAISGKRRQIVRDTLANLEPEQVAMLQLAFFEGLSHDEIASKTGIPLGTVKTRIRAGMMRMRELLEVRQGAL
jgi:RNA polymerase sigma-70 factor (ECF subfamily)